MTNSLPWQDIVQLLDPSSTRLPLLPPTILLMSKPGWFKLCRHYIRSPWQVIRWRILRPRVSKHSSSRLKLSVTLYLPPTSVPSSTTKFYTHVTLPFYQLLSWVVLWFLRSSLIPLITGFVPSSFHDRASISPFKVLPPQPVVYVYTVQCITFLSSDNPKGSVSCDHWKSSRHIHLPPPIFGLIPTRFWPITLFSTVYICWRSSLNLSGLSLSTRRS